MDDCLVSDFAFLALAETEMDCLAMATVLDPQQTDTF